MKTIWKHYYTRPAPVQDFEISIILPTLRQGVSAGLFVYTEGKWEGWYKEKEFNAFLKRTAQRVLRPSWNLHEHLCDFHAQVRSIHGAARRLAKVHSRREAIAAYRRYIRAFDRYWIFIWIPWGITYFLEQWFVEQLRVVVPDAEHTFATIMEGVRPSQSEYLDDALLRWRIKRGNMNDLARIAARYGHLAIYSASHTPWSADDLLHQARAFHSPKRLLEKRLQDRAMRAAHARDALATLRRHPLLYKVGKTLQLYGLLRNERVHLWKRAMRLASPFYRWLEKESGIPKAWSAHLTERETIRFLTNGVLISMHELSRRAHEGYSAYVTRGKTVIVSGRKEHLRFVCRYIPAQRDIKANRVSGAVAYAGKVRGRVRRILHLSDVGTMRNGEILVANMTHPDYMMAIRKARAIVTDEGGVVCHAAIISRELKIPCVIGTGEATKVFQDGDRVEVDAIAGIVRKIA